VSPTRVDAVAGTEEDDGDEKWGASFLGVNFLEASPAFVAGAVEVLTADAKATANTEQQQEEAPPPPPLFLWWPS